MVSRYTHGTGRDLQTLALQVPTDFLEQTLAQLVFLQQMPELADRGFVGRGFPAQVDTDEAAHGQGIVAGLFHGRIREVEPVLKKVDAQHPLQANRRVPVAGLRIHRIDQSTQRRPRHYPIHLGQERRAPRCLAVPIKSPYRERHLFHRDSSVLLRTRRIMQGCIMHDFMNSSTTYLEFP